ncbi:DUF3108 domain-containing protein [Myxococcus sp. CA051A]|uniref:DUF3108 domain-containing protein n=1 Tax=Myxococcus llanfairpwllgwyngyllgogerychwyrndrobwllllantysiliogogogochensis TaxID=2590453 RepID=A0A540WNG8_9BACT|nr:MULTISPECIES: DUF3108 domain-containing protein [Myxococcus]NTX04069.1 DUF3108 domain-containing protein [Myxococcus sp. CA040A]NTX13319.1 DUF3108 domain-containing protein [Myxococcus sp. CA056]NTX36229.1 DUF3108 domain-containing protein [Myxococcus sp. CA033]NTX56377.1 DUF3108 domain-containing protein [Myxococcus sp. CA039A]NTX61779.1 DUF3108 domain-containing protein [Myxococcus sp. CA051A]
MSSLRTLLAAWLMLSSGGTAWAQLPDTEADKPEADKPAEASAAATPEEPPITVEPCAQALPALRMPLAFMPGEVLEFDLDAMGAQAGKMTLRVQKQQDGQIPVLAEAQTNSFFSKVRRVRGSATTWLHPKTLRPKRYVEDATENEMRRKVEVAFTHKDRAIKVDYQIGQRAKGQYNYTYDKDGLDVAGSIYLLRQLPLEENMSVCFDVYGVRRLWRMQGQVLKKEQVTTPLGQFTAWHLQGTAVRLDRPKQKREVHVWLSDDARRLPLAAVGTLDLGAVRATLTSVSRPGEKRQEAGPGKEEMKW